MTFSLPGGRSSIQYANHLRPTLLELHHCAPVRPIRNLRSTASSARVVEPFDPAGVDEFASSASPLAATPLVVPDASLSTVNAAVAARIGPSASATTLQMWLGGVLLLWAASWGAGMLQHRPHPWAPAGNTSTCILHTAGGKAHYAAAPQPASAAVDDTPPAPHAIQCLEDARNVVLARRVPSMLLHVIHNHSQCDLWFATPKQY
jgi:hypothetical protein